MSVVDSSSLSVLSARESLFFGGRDDMPIHDQGSRGLVEYAVQTENDHLGYPESWLCTGYERIERLIGNIADKRAA